MLPVEIIAVQETIVLRARGSELLILPIHVKELKALSKPRDFSQYFRSEALVNRPARKLFEAWLRKDDTLWPRLYQAVHKEMDAVADDAAPKAKADKVDKADKSTDDKKAKATPPKAEKPEKAEKPAAKTAKAEPAKAKPAKADKPTKTKDKPKSDKPAKAESKDKPKAAKADKPAKAKDSGKEAKAKTTKKKG